MPLRICPLCRSEFETRTSCPHDGALLVWAEHDQDESWPTGVMLGDRYLVGPLIGQGGMAQVYRAMDQRLDRPVAIKMLSEAQARVEHIRRRFVLEGQAAMKIQHSNVLKVHDSGTVADVPYIVMELVSGESLAEYLQRQGRMESKLALQLSRQAALGLEATHKAGVVHRDVKPSNLFLMGTAGAPAGLKIIDYGLARLEEVKITATGIAVGTAQYMAPEQVLAESSDPRTDVYGLGVALFRTLTGEWPFHGESDEDVLTHQLFSATPPASWLADGLDPAVDDIVACATRKHPDNRYPSVAALREDIERVLGTRAGQAVALPLQRDPDRYVPTSPLGRRATSALAQRWETPDSQRLGG